MGSDAEQIVRSAPVPVLLVRMPWTKDAQSVESRDHVTAAADRTVGA